MKRRSPPGFAGWPGSLLAVLLTLLLACRLHAEEAGPGRNRIFAVQRDGLAALPLPDEPGADWRVETQDGRRVLRDFAPAGPGGVIRLPAGGWYRLLRRDAAGAVHQVGHRFAAGHVVIVTGQSQADALFFDSAPGYGAYRAEAGGPPAPAVHAVLRDCLGQPNCGPGGTRWDEVGADLGARLLLAELSRRLDGAPVALAGAAWGGASIAQLADAAAPQGQRLRRVAQAAAPASAALILGHGTSDAFLGTAPEAYLAGLGRVAEVLRQAGGPGMPVLLAPLAPLEGEMRLFGSRRLAAWLAPEGREAPLARALAPLGLLRPSRLPAGAAAGAAAIRAAQAEAMDRLDLGPGGDLSGVTLLSDGIHWNRAGVREAVRKAADALAAALRQPR